MKERLFTETGDGWRIALWRYPAPSKAKAHPALLIHGYPSDHRCFDRASGRPGLSPFLQEAGRETWVVEYRTMGDSRPLRGEIDREWTLSDYLTDVFAAMDKMDEVLEPKKIHLVGHSYGGFLLHHVLISPKAARLASATALAAPSFAALPLGRLRPLAPYIMRAAASLPVGPMRLSLVPPRLGLRLIQRVSPGTLVFGLPPHVAEFLMDKTISRAIAGIMKDYAWWFEKGGSMSDYGNLEALLPKVEVPFQSIAGVDDRAGEEAFRHVVERIGSKEKRFIWAGRQTGFKHDYGHVNLVLGRTAGEEIYPLVEEWMSRCDG